MKQQPKNEASDESNNENTSFWKNRLLLTMCFVYIFNFFINNIEIQVFLAAITAIVFVLCVIRAAIFPRIFAPLMLISGLIIFHFKNEGFFAVVDGLTLNLPLLTLILLVPLISIPFKIGGFFNSIDFYLNKMRTNSKKMFLSISAFLFCFGPILNLGSIRVANDMVKDLRLNPIMLGKAYLVGFSTVILWSPYFASVALVLYYLNLNVSEYIFLGLTLAILQLIVGNLLYWLYYNRIERPQQLNFKKREEIAYKEIDLSEGKYHFKNMGKLFLIMVVLMGVVFTLEHLTKWPMMLLVSMIALVVPIVSLAISRKWTETKAQFQIFYENLGKVINNEVVMFVSAGVFASSLSGTSFAQSINLFLTEVASTSFLLFCISVVLMIVFLSYLGIHTIVVVTVLIMQLDPAIIGTTPEVLALLFMISWSISAVLSPVNPLNLLVSNSVGRSAITVGIKWNGTYILAMFIIGMCFVYLIH